ncbi:MAG: hypothetical protein AB1757_25205 [Acidobacteriota bacterium]
MSRSTIAPQTVNPSFNEIARDRTGIGGHLVRLTTLFSPRCGSGSVVTAGALLLAFLIRHIKKLSAA